MPPRPSGAPAPAEVTLRPRSPSCPTTPGLAQGPGQSRKPGRTFSGLRALPLEGGVWTPQHGGVGVWTPQHGGVGSCPHVMGSGHLRELRSRAKVTVTARRPSDRTGRFHPARSPLLEQTGDLPAKPAPLGGRSVLPAGLPGTAFPGSGLQKRLNGEVLTRGFWSWVLETFKHVSYECDQPAHPAAGRPRCGVSCQQVLGAVRGARHLPGVGGAGAQPRAHCPQLCRGGRVPHARLGDGSTPCVCACRPCARLYTCGAGRVCGRVCEILTSSACPALQGAGPAQNRPPAEAAPGRPPHGGVQGLHQVSGAAVGRP